MLQQTLDDAYREAFFLSRAKGIADAAALAAIAPRATDQAARMREYALPLVM